MSDLKTHLSYNDDNIKSLMMSEFKRVDSSIENLHNLLETAIEIRERLASLEGRIGVGFEA